MGGEAALVGVGAAVEGTVYAIGIVALEAGLAVATASGHIAPPHTVALLEMLHGRAGLEDDSNTLMTENYVGRSLRSSQQAID